MSEINPSEMTRASILSAETDRPHSASQEHRSTPIREVPRGVASPSSLTPTRTPTRTPVALQQGLGTQHSNYSRGNLSLHSQHSEQQLRGQEYELDEHGRKIPMHSSLDEEHENTYVEDRNQSHTYKEAASLTRAAVGASAASAAYHPGDDDHEDPELLEDDQPTYYQNTQEVPPPLRYVPYGHERRGLSPIQSVSGYTEGDPEPQQRSSRLTRSSGSYSSLGKSIQQSPGKSMRSVDSVGNVHHNRHDFPDVRQGGLTESELTQDGEYWEEQHQENDRNRDLDAESYRSSNPNVDYHRMTNYTDDSMDVDRIAAGQNVRGVAQNAEFVHTPVAVESAVASLVNASDLTGYTGNNDKYGRRSSLASFDDGSERHFTSRGNSPTKHRMSREVEYSSDRGSSSQRNSPSKYPEYDLDENGRKITMPKYGKTSTEKGALAGIAAGAAAAVLRGRNKKPEADKSSYESVSEHTGAPLQKSFKERALEGQGQIPSPRQSVDAHSLNRAESHEQVKMSANAMPLADNPEPEIGHIYDDASDLTTNPSVINGPIMEKDSRDHWPDHQTSQPRLNTESRSQKSDSHAKGAEAVLGAAADVAAYANHSRETSRDFQDEEWRRTSGEQKRDTLVTNPYEGTSPIAAIGLDPGLLAQSGFQSPGHEYGPPKMNFQNSSPLLRDEGYISSAPNARSPGTGTPEPKLKNVGFEDEEIGGAANALNGGDPFYSPKHQRHPSGMSHGMGSPIYDSATGNGIDRIQSKDIVALMDHLTVRDAQRSARDTEILVTLVRAAAEMRNSFEDMKRLLADTEDVIITEVQGNTEKSVQKVINGPRPFPQSGARSLRQGSQDEMYDDIRAKKRNVFQRALKGLSMRSSNDLGKIEEMLVTLLGEVEGLKAAQGLKTDSQHAGSFIDLHQEGNYGDDRGYEPEGNAGTSTASHGSQSGHLSLPLPLSRGPSATRGFDGRKFSDHRISTVPEGDEEEHEVTYSHHSQRSRHAQSPHISIDPHSPQDHHDPAIIGAQFEDSDRLQTPTREFTRGGSAPLGTPPQQQVPQASLSNENTPRTEKSKKHKSSSSSGWIPKVSRWSETTASTVLRGFRSSKGSGNKKGEEYMEPPSRSGSDLGHYAEPNHNPYGEDKLHSGFSQDQIQQYDENEPLSMLPPEDPKYKAHRNSLNLQHPQPRPGPTVRYQTALESQAHNFDQPMSPKSVDWGSTTSLNNLPPQQTNRYSTGTGGTGGGALSPITDGGYSNGSASNQQAPARPPKEPLAPERPPKIRSGKLQKPSPLSREHLQTEEDRPYSPSYEPGGSPRSAARKLSGSMGGVPTRKPTGPRQMSSPSRSGELNRDDGTVIRRNKNRDTFGTVASNNSAESETF
ncbi:hypothetical protein BGZ60DRAFT_365193 [Tricladium varicosporioides]|nr:hypothetical protein BGZ60DRAFT_365193 [Hymenoscyphus varicosporioides]